MHALDEPSPLVRAHVAWTIAQIARRQPLPDTGTTALRALLAAAQAHEPDADVGDELAAAAATLD